jgi:hypothetical protein
MMIFRASVNAINRMASKLTVLLKVFKLTLLPQSTQTLSKHSGDKHLETQLCRSTIEFKVSFSF